jgi:hypothetical protein
MISLAEVQGRGGLQHGDIGDSNQRLRLVLMLKVPGAFG